MEVSQSETRLPRLCIPDGNLLSRSFAKGRSIAGVQLSVLCILDIPLRGQVLLTALVVDLI